MDKKPPSGVYIVWRGYQRRAEVVATRLGLELVFLEHRTGHRWFRPLDYLLALLRTSLILARRRPLLAVFQSPPIFAALPARVLRIPYVIDAHNATFQSFWHEVPGSRWLVHGAQRLIVHNEEIADLAARQFPRAMLISIQDPVDRFEIKRPERVPCRVVPVCSFAEDEPIELLVEVMKQAPDLEFYITANLSRLPPELAGAVRRLQNVRCVGFLPVRDYQRLLSSAAATLVLTTRTATQPSGACEALSSDTPLVISRTTLTETLFGSWATLVSHDPVEIVHALRQAVSQQLDLHAEREVWNRGVAASLSEIARLIGQPA